MRVLGLDMGDRRIGVAISDPSGKLATGLSAIQRRGIESDLRAVEELIREFDVERIVVGLPYLMDGRLGEQGAKVKTFAERLAERVLIPIDFWDERLSTFAAESALIEAGFKPSKRKARVDAVAAAIILQDYLDSQKRAPASEVGE